MNKFIILSSLLILLFSTSCSKTQYTITKVRMNNKIYKLETADTTEKKSKGLMYRKKLHDDQGMLFVYSYETMLHFYMKNTLIPLDIAFVDAQKIIINIEHMKPLDESIVSSKKEAMYAIEMNEGFFEKSGIQPGDSIDFLTPVRYNP